MLVVALVPVPLFHQPFTKSFAPDYHVITRLAPTCLRCKQVLAVDEIPLAYLPGGVVRLHVKVVGDLKIAQPCPKQYDSQNESDLQLSPLQQEEVQQHQLSLQHQPTSPVTPQQESRLGHRLSVLDSASPPSEPLQLPSAPHQPEPSEPHQPPRQPHATPQHSRQPHDPDCPGAHDPKPPEPHHPATTDSYQPESPELHHSDPSQTHHPQSPGPHYPDTSKPHHPDPSGSHSADPSEASLRSDDMAPAAQGSEAGRLHSMNATASVHVQSSTDSLQPSRASTAAPAAATAGSPAFGSSGPEAGAEADSVPQCLGSLSHSEGSIGAATAEWVITKEHVDALAIGNATHDYNHCYYCSKRMLVSIRSWQGAHNSNHVSPGLSV